MNVNIEHVQNMYVKESMKDPLDPMFSQRAFTCSKLTIKH